MEVPDEDTSFSVQFTVFPPPNSPALCANVLVDGQKAESYAATRMQEVATSGIRIGTDAAGRKLIQPFMFCKANREYNDNQSDDDDGEGEDDTATKKNKAAGTIALELCQTRPVLSGSTKLMAGYAFTPRSVVPDKKDSFGIERSVGLGATTTGDHFRLANYTAGEFIEKLEVRYRTAKFFHMLQCRIDPQEVKRAEGPVAVIDLVDDDEDEEDTERRAKKRIKLELAAPSTPALGNDATADTFLCRLAPKEAMEMSSLKPLLLELIQRNLTTVGQLRQLSRDQWRDVMRASGLPASLSISAGQIASPPVCLVLDD